MRNFKNKSVVVLLLSKGDYRNDSRVMREIESLRRKDYSVTLLTLASGVRVQPEYLENGCYVVPIKIRSINFPSNQICWFLKYFEWIVRLIFVSRHLDFQIVHSNDLPTLFPGWLISKIGKSKLVYDTHELFTEQFTQNLMVRTFWTICESILIKQAHIVFAENRKCTEYLIRRYNIRHVTPLNNMQWFQKYSKNTQLKDVLRIKSEKKLILYQGAIKLGRGLEMLIDLASTLPQYEFVVLGHGGYRRYIKERSQSLGCNNFHILEAVPKTDLHFYTSSADLGIFLIQKLDLNYYYATSNKIFEYLMAGLPIVFSDFPEMRHIINKYKVGYTVNENDPVDIKCKIIKILEDPEIWDTMHRNALDAVRTDLNWERESLKLIRLYKNVTKIEMRSG